MPRWIHSGGNSKPDKRFKNVLTPKKGAKKKRNNLLRKILPFLKCSALW